MTVGRGTVPCSNLILVGHADSIVRQSIGKVDKTALSYSSCGISGAKGLWSEGVTYSGGETAFYSILQTKV